MIDEYEDQEPLACWEAYRLPDCQWEAYEQDGEDGYYGRVKNPMTFGRWAWGYFSKDELRNAAAYRVDIEDDEQLFPDGGYTVEKVVDEILEDTESRDGFGPEEER
jgi:hypothetical protein